MNITNGDINFIKDFDFGGDSVPSDKLFLVLLIDSTNLVLIHALPTSKNRFSVDDTYHGCKKKKQYLIFFLKPISQLGHMKMTFLFLLI